MSIFALRDSLQTGCRLRALLATLSLLCMHAAAAQEQAQEQNVDTGQHWMTVGSLPKPPHWSLEIKGGKFEPELEAWETFYGEDHTDQFSVALGYKFLRQAEVGLAVDKIQDDGVGNLPLNNMLGGQVDFQMYPAHVYVLLRGIFSENQWVVPFIGGGITRVYYRQQIDNQPSVRGKAEGDHIRAGLQILLDRLDQGNAAGFEEESVNNTYLVVEALSFSAEIDGIELGGESMQFGFVFEF